MGRMRNNKHHEFQRANFDDLLLKKAFEKHSLALVVYMLMERSIEIHKDPYILCFMDYSEAFSKVRHGDL